MTTGIQWTGETWNPVAGCTIVSDGCDNCYAIPNAVRMADSDPLYKGMTKQVDGIPEWTGRINTSDSVLEQPEKWKIPTLVFVNSMSDIFHIGVPDEFIDKIYDVMEKVDRHIYQVLTKRDARMQKYVNKRYRDQKPPEHIWHGVSVETNKFYPRIRHLQETKSAIRFLSLEPMLGAMPDLPLYGIHWVIVGGESGGPEDRQLKNEDHVRDIQKQCNTKNVAFFFNQWGGKTAKAGGNELDGQEWLEFPVDVSGYDHGVVFTGDEKDKKIEELKTTATKIRGLIEKAETGHVSAYTEIGKELCAARPVVKETGQKWLVWLEERDIPRRTASRAIRYFEKPDTYREDRIKDALAKRDVRKQAGQPSGPKKVLLKAIKGATDSEVEIIRGLITADRSLVRLHALMAAETKGNGSMPTRTNGGTHPGQPSANTMHSNGAEASPLPN